MIIMMIIIIMITMKPITMIMIIHLTEVNVLGNDVGAQVEPPPLLQEDLRDVHQLLALVLTVRP